MKILTQFKGLEFEIDDPAITSELIARHHADTLLVPISSMANNGQINKSLTKRMEYFILERPEGSCTCEATTCIDLRDLENVKSYLVMNVAQVTIDYMLAIAK